MIIKKLIHRLYAPAGDGTDGGGTDHVADLEAQAAEADLADLDSQTEGGDAGEDRATEQEALSKGWTAKDKFRGDPGKWVDAKTFVERGKRFNQNLQNEVVSLKRQLEEFKGTALQFKKFHEETLNQKDSDLKAAQAELKTRLRAANREGDDDLADTIEGRMEVLREAEVKLAAEKAAAVAPVAPAAQEVNPVLQSWIDEDNSWFKDDSKMRAYAIEIGQELKKAQPNLEGRAFLDQVREQMESDFPSKFAPTARNPRRSIADGGNRTTSQSAAGHSFRDLPKADRDLCLQFVKEGWTTQEKFVESYFERNS